MSEQQDEAAKDAESIRRAIEKSQKAIEEADRNK